MDDDPGMRLEAVKRNCIGQRCKRNLSITAENSHLTQCFKEVPQHISKATRGSQKVSLYFTNKHSIDGSFTLLNKETSTVKQKNHKNERRYRTIMFCFYGGTGSWIEPLLNTMVVRRSYILGLGMLKFQKYDVRENFCGPAYFRGQLVNPGRAA